MTSLDRRPNEALRRARGDESQEDLADRVNATIYRATGQVTTIRAKQISDWERGWYTWPSADVRGAFRYLFRLTDAELGFYKKRRATAAASPVALLDLTEGRIALPSGAIKTLGLPGGRAFPVAELIAHHCPVEEAGPGWLMVEATDEVSSSLRRTDRWNAVFASDANGKYYVSGSHRFPQQTSRGGVRQPVAAANVLDDLTTGIVWAVVHTDNALLADDASLEMSQSRLAHYVEWTSSAVAVNEAPELTAVAAGWLGSTFCSRHISRHLDRLIDRPFFWTCEQRGEDAAAWLLWNHKLDYLRLTSSRFSGMRRAFCIPESEVLDSPVYERVLLLLAMVLMEGFGIAVELSTDPALAEVGGFVLAEEAITADWLRGEGLWRVDARPPRDRVAAYRQLREEVAATSVIAGGTSARRLESIADYLGVSWPWFRRRCEELAAAGVEGIARPKSRHLSTRGLDAAIRYVAHLNSIEGANLARS